jgi:hypothetical protein
LKALYLSVNLKANNPMQKENPNDHLLIVWTSGDPEVAHKMVFMYAYNARRKGWWKQVSLLVWGPSAKLASENKDIQGSLKKMKSAGIELIACKACADLYNVSAGLEKIGIEVKYSGIYLTEFLKSGQKVISF